MSERTRKTTIVSAALAILGLGASGPGCALPTPAPADTLGSFCAAPARGDEFCVPSKEGPAAAWKQAAAHGRMPIQMWAKWPDGVTLDELVESRGRLEDWFADLDKVVAYVRDTKRSAESYKASLGGNLGKLLKQAKDRQAERIAQKPVDAIGGFKAALTDKGRIEKSPRLATIAADKQAMAAAQAVFDKAKGDAAPISASYAKVVTQFTAYRATEAEETATYTSLAQQASQATLATIPDVEQAILAAAKDASAKPNNLAFFAMKLSAQIQAFELSAQTSILPHRDFLATHGAALPDMTSAALRSLNAMLGYLQQRVTRSDATATSLLNGIAMRQQALVLLLNAPQPVRDTVAEARLLQARESFRDASSARATALAAPPETSKNLKLPYLARRYDQLTALLQMQPLCEASSASWRETGCSSLRGSFGAAEAYLKTTLPTLIATGLATMRGKGVDAALLDAAQAKLQAGDVKGAALVYDAAVRSSEGT